jgi:hypothetical protein
MKVYRETEEIHERFAVGLPGSRSRPTRIVSTSPEATEPGTVSPSPVKATAVRKDEVAFTTRDSNEMVLQVDSHCESSSDEVIELKYMRARDMALKGRRTDRVQNVRVHFGDKNKKAGKKVSFAVEADAEVTEQQLVEEDRKRKRRESPPSPTGKHKKDKL